MTDVTASKKSKQRWFVVLLIVFIAAVAGMGVAWVKSLPKITVAEGKVTITNCELPLPTYAIGVCPKLYCKKEILESGLFPLHSEIGFNKPKPSADPVLAGSIRYRLEDGGDLVTRDFECELDGDEVRGLSYL